MKDARGGIAAWPGRSPGSVPPPTPPAARGNKFKLALAGINLASGVLEPALAGAVVAAGGLAAAFAAAGAGAAAYGAALKPLLSQAQGVMKAQDDAGQGAGHRAGELRRPPSSPGPAPRPPTRPGPRR